jgi:hypothetical protein
VTKSIYYGKSGKIFDILTLKMRFVIPEDPEDYNNLKLNGDLAKETLKKRASIVAKWDEFLQIFKLRTLEFEQLYLNITFFVIARFSKI